MSSRILVVDDESGIRAVLQRYLSQQGYEVAIAENGHAALTTFGTFQPDLVVLDLNLPDLNGFDLCEKMQQETNVYVLMLTGRQDPVDKLRGFSLGADDYLTKPFNLPEVGARVAAILKRCRPMPAASEEATPTLLEFSALRIDPVGREVWNNSTIVALTALEFNLLYEMAKKPGRAWQRLELIKAVWAADHDGDERVVDVHIGQIRKKLEAAAVQPDCIRTVRGIGYKFEPPAPPEMAFP